MFIVWHIIAGGTWQRIIIGDAEMKYFENGNAKLKTFAPSIKQNCIVINRSRHLFLFLCE